MRYDFTRNNGTVKKRIICFVMGMILLFASIVPAGFNIFAKEAETYRHMSFELHPDEDDLDKTVSLDGLMPKNASAEVVEVTDSYVDDEYFTATPSDGKREEDNTAVPAYGKKDRGTQSLLRETDDTASAGDADHTASATDADKDYENEDYSGEDIATGSDADKDKGEAEYTTIAAYDITIRVGKKEYQPTEKRPIRVEITDARISQDKNVLLYHIKDDGEREEITDITIEDGKLSFDATGFSVYEIVKYDSGDVDLFELLAEQGPSGIEVSYMASEKKNLLSSPNRGGPYYLYNEVVTVDSATGRKGINSSKEKDNSNAAKLYFEKAEEGTDKFYIYFKNADESKNYVEMYTGSFGNTSRAALRFAATKDERTLFTLEKHPDSDQIRIYATINNNKYLWIRNGYNTTQNMPVVGYAYSEQGDAGTVWLTLESLEKDADSLDGKTYGLMNYNTGTHGYALMADGGVHSLIQMVTHPSKTKEGTVLYVDEGSEITRWTFHKQENGKYKLSAEVEGGVKYLAADGDSLTLVDTVGSASEFEVISASNGRLRLKTGGKYVSFTSVDDGQNEYDSFTLSSSSSVNSLLYLVDYTTLSDSDLISYSADRISVSDVVNGQKVIVYTRIWNETTKKYDIYAIDYNGKLYPCYASGGKILWLGDGTCSLEWVFTEYLDEVTKQPNYYYDLYNTYSEKYIAPQLFGDQILSEDTIGINMPGRRNGEY